MPRPLNEQIVVIIGASSGIGRESAIQFAQAGAAVVLAARDEITLQILADQITARGGQARLIPTDVSDSGAPEYLAHETMAAFGRIDTWIHDAAVAIYSTIAQTEVSEFERIIDVNLMGVVRGCKAVLPHFLRQGYGTIISPGSFVSGAGCHCWGRTVRPSTVCAWGGWLRGQTSHRPDSGHETMDAPAGDPGRVHGEFVHLTRPSLHHALLQTPGGQTLLALGGLALGVMALLTRRQPAPGKTLRKRLAQR